MGKSEGHRPGRGGLYIFEGIDGSGKTTQIRLASANLTARNIEHSIVEVPGRSHFSCEIREILNRIPSSEVSPAVEALLHLAMIRNTMEKYILPALAQGRYVLMDRSHLSTAAYQGATDNQLFKLILNSSNSWLSSIVPHQVFFFDLEPATAVNRIQMRGDDLDKYDNMSVKSKQNVRQRFLELKNQIGERFHLIDATQSVIDISSIIFSCLMEDIKKSSGAYDE